MPCGIHNLSTRREASASNSDVLVSPDLADSMTRREAMTSHNQAKGTTLLTSKAVMAIASAIVPEIYKIDAREQQRLMELVNQDEGAWLPAFKGLLASCGLSLAWRSG